MFKRKQRLKYAGSIVLGLNDALVELTGALAGNSFALQNTRLIGVIGLITGVAAAMSMSASEYLSVKTEDSGKNPKRSALHTGLAYLLTVFALIAPFFIFSHYLVSLSVTLIIAFLIIAGFTYFIAKAHHLSFAGRFYEMAGISLGVALVSFIFGYLIKTYLGIEI